MQPISFAGGTIGAAAVVEAAVAGLRPTSFHSSSRGCFVAEETEVLCCVDDAFVGDEVVTLFFDGATTDDKTLK